MDLGVEDAAIRAQSDTFIEAYQARDVVAILMLFGDNPTVSYAGDPPAEGLAAVRAHLEKRWADNPKLTRTASVDRVWLSGMGDLAVEIGSWKDEHMGPEGSGSEEGRYLRVWRRLDGAWKIWADTTASAPPSPS